MVLAMGSATPPPHPMPPPAWCPPFELVLDALDVVCLPPFARVLADRLLFFLLLLAKALSPTLPRATDPLSGLF